MKSLSLLLFSFLGFSPVLCAQDFSQPAKDAFLITRMVAKYHLAPRPLDDTFSKDVFSEVFRLLDEEKMLFTEEDIRSLEKYKGDMDDAVRLQKTDFLQAVAPVFIQRLHAADSAISAICKKPFDFSLNETFTRAAIKAYPADIKSWHTKLYKILKGSALYKIIDDEGLGSYSGSAQKAYLDSIEPLIRKKVLAEYHNAIQTVLNSPGGALRFIGDAYCKAIALCYDPHTEYFPVSEKEDFESALGDKTMAFGFQFKRSDDGSIRIDNVLPGSPAFRSGQINRGDKIQSIRWDEQSPIDVADADWELLNKVLNLSNHGKATFRIKKQDGTIKTVTLWKERLEDENDENKVKSFILKGNKKIGFISLPAFYQDWDDKEAGINGCANDIAREILKLKKENIEGLILDLRYNGGGSVAEAVGLAGIFIDAGPVAQVKGKDSLIYTLKDVNRGTIYDGPLVLMVNGYSASASELVAGTLQDYNRALIVGSPTYGKATAQIVLPLDTGITDALSMSRTQAESYIKVTISQLYRVNGGTAQATGVQPDILLPDLSETMLKREKDQPFFIRPSPLPAVKYFRALQGMDAAPLRSLAAQQMDSSLFFARLKQYAKFYKAKDTAASFSLKLSEVLSEQNKMNAVNVSGSGGRAGSAFTVENNAFEKQQMSTNENLKAMNEQWADFLLNDPQLSVAFNIISAMTK